MKGILYPAIDMGDLPPLTEEEWETVPALMGKNAGKVLSDLIEKYLKHQAGSLEGGDSLLEEG